MSKDQHDPAAGYDVEVTDAEGRRTFLKGAVMKGAAGLGAVALGAGLARAQGKEGPAIARVPIQRSRAHVGIRFERTQKVTIDHVFGAVKDILGRTGCPTCGLAGIHLDLGLAVQSEQLKLRNAMARIEGELPR